MMALRCGAEVNSMMTLFNGSVLAEGQTYRRHARGRRKNTVVRGERFVNPNERSDHDQRRDNRHPQ
jgi:hypothetical protein